MNVVDIKVVVDVFGTIWVPLATGTPRKVGRKPIFW